MTFDYLSIFVFILFLLSVFFSDVYCLFSHVCLL